MVPKLDILGAELLEFDVLAFTETWLNSSYASDDIRLESFREPERKDRVGDSHGGVIIYVKDSIHYRRRNDLELRGIECIWIQLTLKHKHVLFGLFYRPPNSDSIYYSGIEDSIHLAIDSGITDIIITGDFNFNMLNNQTSRKINTFCEQFSLFQCINEPTHFTENSSTLLDILLVTNKDHLILCGVGDPFLHQEQRYHCPIYGVFNFRKPKVKAYKRRIWKYNDGNYELLRQKVTTTDWSICHNSDINVYAQNIVKTLNALTETCVPNKIVTFRSSDPPWLTTVIKKHIRKRKRAYRKAKQTNLQTHWVKFKHLRNLVTSMIRESKKAFHDNIANKLKSDSLSSKQWWTILKSFISPYSKSSIPPLEADGVVYSDEMEKANVLNDFFRDQTLLDDQNAILPNIPSYPVNSTLDSIIVTPEEVSTVLLSLPLGKSAGPDGINNRILREVAKEFSPALCLFFNTSLRLGEVPGAFKEAHVTPVPKGGDVTLVSNHRPISLLSNLDKVLERLVFKHLHNHFVDNNILTPFQSGFTPGDSTVNQLTYLYNTLCHALDSGKEVRVIFCDISKAFDRVWHAGLVHKLQAAGISGSFLQWLINYLSNRKQRVVLPGVQSKWNFIYAGVPQGSILGPLLFLLYINDIVVDIRSSIRLFADDTSLYIIVDNPDHAAQLLNADLEKITNWAETWLVKFNPDKTESLLISRKTSGPIHPPVFMLNQEVNEVDKHKHLGIVLSGDCSWHHHINYIKEKAWARINIMRKLKFLLDRKSLETIYISFIRPVIEYADIIWDNCTQTDKQELEKIQLEAARISTGATKLISVQKLYEETGWEPLEIRRKKHKLALFYKMYNHLTPPYLSSLVPPLISNFSRYNLRNANDIQTIDSRTTLYFNSFLPSVIRDWNSLPHGNRNADSLNSFKRQINLDRKNIPKYYYSGTRRYQIIHTRLRTGCSSLNYDLFLKNILDDPLCRCNSGSVENAQHFLLNCRLYREQRIELYDTVSQYCNITLDVLLYGDESLSYETNISVFEAVHKYIQSSKRF